MPNPFKSSSCEAAVLSIQWVLPEQCYPSYPAAAEEAVAGPTAEPAWMGVRLEELRRWERLEVMGQPKCGQH